MLSLAPSILFLNLCNLPSSSTNEIICSPRKCSNCSQPQALKIPGIPPFPKNLAILSLLPQVNFNLPLQNF